jgi:hypothetical protein
MTYTPSITAAQVFTGLKAWLMDTLGLGTAAVVQELQNRSAAPKTGFVNMLHKTQKRQGANTVIYSGTGGTVTTTTPKDFQIQADCYGTASGDWANVIATMWQSPLAVAFLAPYGLTPLWADDPVELSGINGEEQYEERWIVLLHMQSNPTMAAPMTFLTVPKPTILDILTKP